MNALPSRRSASGSTAHLGRRARLRGLVRFVVPLVLVVLALAAWVFWPFARPAAPVVRSSVLVEEIRAAAKLSTVEVHATVVTNRDESAWYGSRFLFQVVPGRAAVGFDLAAWQTSSLHIAQDGTVTVTLPAPQVLSVDVDLEHVETYNNVGLLRPQFTPEETQELLALARQKIRERAETPAVMEQARTRAAELVERLATAAGAKAVTVEFETAPR